MIKTISMKKKEALQIAEKRIEAKGKGEKERYTILNAEYFFFSECRVLKNSKERKESLPK